MLPVDNEWRTAADDAAVSQRRENKRWNEAGRRPATPKEKKRRKLKRIDDPGANDWPRAAAAAMVVVVISTRITTTTATESISSYLFFSLLFAVVIDDNLIGFTCIRRRIGFVCVCDTGRESRTYYVDTTGDK